MLAEEHDGKREADLIRYRDGRDEGEGGDRRENALPPGEMGLEIADHRDAPERDGERRLEDDVDDGRIEADRVGKRPRCPAGLELRHPALQLAGGRRPGLALDDLVPAAVEDDAEGQGLAVIAELPHPRQA